MVGVSADLPRFAEGPPRRQPFAEALPETTSTPNLSTEIRFKHERIHGMLLEKTRDTPGDVCVAGRHEAR
jgi:hypothetical protein